LKDVFYSRCVTLCFVHPIRFLIALSLIMALP
jgi:hypothetical protein